MDTILKDYIQYYKVRMQRYEGDKMVAHSYQTEKALYDAIASVSSMEELQQNKTAEFGRLSVENGVALSKDGAACRLEFYKKEKEDIYAKGEQALLDKVTTATDAYSITTIVNEVMAKNSIEISVDTMWPMTFFSMIDVLEKIEICQKAIVPDTWKTDMQQLEKDYIQSLQTQMQSFLKSIRHYRSDWKVNYEILWEYRHRKKSPLSDAILKQRIAEHTIYCKDVI